MINHKDVMYWITKEDYIKVIDLILCCSEEKVRKLQQKFLIEKELFVSPKHLIWFGQTTYGKLFHKRIDLIDELDDISNKAIFLERININNINFKYKSEEMKTYLDYIECGGIDVKLNVVEE